MATPGTAKGPGSRLLLGYVLAVDLCAIAVGVALARDGCGPSPGYFLLLTGLGALGGVCPVRIPRLRLNLTASHPFVFCAIAVCGFLGAAVVGVVGVLAAAIGRRSLPPPIHLAFNLGAAVLCAGASAVTYQAVGGFVGSVAPLTVVLPALMIATFAYFLLNMILVSAAISLEQGLGYAAVLWRTSRATGLTYLSAMTLAVMLVATEGILLPWGLLAALSLLGLGAVQRRRHATAGS